MKISLNASQHQKPINISLFLGNSIKIVHTHTIDYQPVRMLSGRVVLLSFDPKSETDESGTKDFLTHIDCCL